MTEATRRDLRDLFDLALRYNEELAQSSAYPIHTLLNEGCDLHLDVIPAIKEVIDRRHKGRNVSKISKFLYFEDAVRDWHQRRLSVERKKAEPARPPGDIHQKAKMAARTVRVFGIQDATAIRFLEGYEREHGEVRL